MKSTKELVPGEVIEVQGWMWEAYGRPTYIEGDTDMAAQGFLKLFPATVKFTVPDDFNANASAVAAIDAHMERLTHDYHQNIQMLREQKESLLALPAPAPAQNTEPEEQAAAEPVAQPEEQA